MSDPKHDGAASPERPAELDSTAAIRGLWQRRGFLLIVTACLAVMGYGLSYLWPPVYTARVTILPQQEDRELDVLSQFAGLAGLGLGGATTYEELYPRIIRSDRVLDPVISRTWPSRRSGQGASLFAVFGLEQGHDDTLDERRSAEELKEILRTKVIRFSRDRSTGFMELQVSVPREPELAAALANDLVERLEAYNRAFHRSRAVEQREFISGRLREVKGDLERAEDAMTAFVSTNRAYASSPELMQRHNDLQREVDAQTSIWIELRRQLELTKIDEHKELESVNVLDHAAVPLRSSSPRRLIVASIAGMLGLMLAAGIVLGQLAGWLPRRFR